MTPTGHTHQGISTIFQPGYHRTSGISLASVPSAVQNSTANHSVREGLIVSIFSPKFSADIIVQNGNVDLLQNILDHAMFSFVSPACNGPSLAGELSIIRRKADRNDMRLELDGFTQSQNSNVVIVIRWASILKSNT